MANDNVPDLVHRFWSEFRDWPTLKLTLVQAQRLFDVSEERCRRVVAALWMTGHVQVDRGQLVVGPAERVPPSTDRSTNAAQLTKGSGARVLVIEDDHAQLQGLAIGLRAAGYTVLGARDAGHGTASAFLKPDVIVLDIGLPDSDGHSIARCLRADPDTAAIPIIYLTARRGPDDVARAKEIGAAAYLVKPCRTQDVVAVISTLLNDSGAA